MLNGVRGFRPFLCLRRGQIFVSSCSIDKHQMKILNFSSSNLPDNQKELEAVADVLLLIIGTVFQLGGEHDDFDGLLPFEGYV